MANPTKNSVLHLEGKRFGKWTVLEYVGIDSNSNKSSLWKCRCNCGKIQVMRGTNLTQGHSKSCRSCALKGNNCARSLPFGEAAFNSLYYSYKNRAKRFNIDFKLTKFNFRKLTKQKCYYCDNEPNQTIQGAGQNGYYLYNGIDRVDNLKGYVVDNCVACCKVCNYMKKASSLYDFYKHIECIYKTMKDKVNE